jgi:ceramide glucosyltransferase
MNAAPFLLSAAAAGLGALAAAGIAYALLASVLVGRFFARPRAEPSEFPAVTIVKPVHGPEAALLRNLSSFCRQDYPGPVQILFGVADPEDPALGVIGELRRLHPDADLTVVADPTLHGPNRKVSNLINLMPQARHDILVFADSDVGVGPDYLRGVVGELQRPGIELVTCLYWGEPDPGFWPRVSALGTNTAFVPGVVTGLALGMARPCFGQTIALRRPTLDRIGGFAPFVRLLAEDHAIGEAVRRAGGGVSVPPFAVSHACAETTLGRLVAHELRWNRTIRAVDPAGYLGSAVAHPLPFALLAALFSGGAAWAWALAGAALAARLVLKARADRALGQRIRDPWLLPFWDLLSFGFFAAAFLSGRVTWRGHRYRVDAKGRLTTAAGDA